MTRPDSPDAERPRPAGAQTVERAFEVLCCLRELPGPATVGEIARLMGLNVTAVHRMLRAMEHTGFLEQDPATRRYRLGTAIAGLNLLCTNGRGGFQRSSGGDDEGSTRF